MHTPDPVTESPGNDQSGDVRQPPVPPDKAPDVVPQRDPPKPGRHGDGPPLIAAAT